MPDIRGARTIAKFVGTEQGLFDYTTWQDTKLNTIFMTNPLCKVDVDLGYVLVIKLLHLLVE